MASQQRPSAGETLRERKKQHTRDALSWAALRLAVERGFNDVLVEDIAAAAGVSARTFNNYFAGKAEAIVSRHFDRARRTAVELRERPAGEPLWEAITAAALSVAAEDSEAPDSDWQDGVRLMMTEPALQGEFFKAAAAADRELAEAVAERTGTDLEHDLFPTLAAAAVGTAIQVATSRWLTAQPPVPLIDLLNEALGQLAAGLPGPRPA